MPEKFKAVITATKSTFLQKCISFNENIEDGYNPKLYTKITVFVPKLSPEYIIPTVMVNISNGHSSVLMRAGTPLELKRHLQHIIEMLETELFKERWERITDISDNIIDSGTLPVAYDKLYFQKR